MGCRKSGMGSRQCGEGHAGSVSQARLDVALGSLVWWLATLHIAGGLKLDDRCGPLQPRPFYDSVIPCSERLFELETVDLQQ